MSRKIHRLLLAVLLCCSALTSCSKERVDEPAPRAKNLILIVVDTLGAEHLSSYDPSLNHTPSIQEIAEDGIVFERAYSTAPWTKASIASLFTSLWPSEHRVQEIKDRLSDRNETMAELLKLHGWSTTGIISHTLITKKHGFAQGFDSYRLVELGGNPHQVVTSEKVTDAAIEQLKTGTGNQFLFVHYFDPHFNYQHHPEFDQTSWYKGRLKPGMDIRELRKLIPTLTKEEIRYLIGLYREEIAYTDNQLGRLFDYLRSSGQARDTLVILTADHGEEFMRHGGLGHTHTLYDELVHVPLIFWQPGAFSGNRILAPVSQVDLLPTVLSYLGVNERRAGWRGIDLSAALISGTEPPPSRDIFLEVDFDSSNIKAHKLAVSRGAEKLILDKPTTVRSLFDRTGDPQELNDLRKSDPGASAALDALLTGFEEHFQSGDRPAEEPALEHKPDEIEHLKSLGYM